MESDHSSHSRLLNTNNDCESGGLLVDKKAVTAPPFSWPRYFLYLTFGFHILGFDLDFFIIQKKNNKDLAQHEILLVILS